MIQTITKYKFGGKEYAELKEVKKVVENQIGELVIDKIRNECPNVTAKEQLKILEILTRPEIRSTLTDLLNVKYEVSAETDEYHAEKKNILDL